MIDISNKLEGKVVSITGASGYIGSALIEELEKYSLKIIRISRKKLVPKDGVVDWVLDLNKKSSWIKIVIMTGGSGYIDSALIEKLVYL